MSQLYLGWWVSSAWVSEWVVKAWYGGTDKRLFTKDWKLHLRQIGTVLLQTVYFVVDDQGGPYLLEITRLTLFLPLVPAASIFKKTVEGLGKKRHMSVISAPTSNRRLYDKFDLLITNDRISNTVASLQCNSYRAVKSSYWLGTWRFFCTLSRRVSITRCASGSRGRFMCMVIWYYLYITEMWCIF